MLLLYMCQVSLLLVNFPRSSTHSSKCSVSFPIVPIVKLAKTWILLENLAHTQTKSGFSFETCVITPKILLSNLGGVGIFNYVRYF